MTISFDVISDLHLIDSHQFDWECKATSLYCIVAGNISEELALVHQTLLNLSRFYQGVFYIPGNAEYHNRDSIRSRTTELTEICGGIRNVVFLHQNVVILDGVAVMGAHGWYGNSADEDMVTAIRIENQRYEDITYMGSTIEKLQLHLDVKKIIMVTSSVPGRELFFGEEPRDVFTQVSPQEALVYDTESKVTHWIFGSYNKVTDISIDNVRYINNSSYHRSPYWAKRIEIEI